MTTTKALVVAGAVAVSAISAIAALDTREVTVESNGNRVYKRVDHNGTVRLSRRLSDKPCVQGRSWGYDRDGIWVDDGCRAIFRYDTRGTSGRVEDRIRDIFGIGNRDNTSTVRFKLESDGGRETKRIDTSGGVRLIRRLSDKPCVQGRSWGYTRDGVWVDDGCRAEFEVGRYTGSSRDPILPGRGVPNWAVGTWVGVRNARDLDMRIRSDGTLTVRMRGDVNEGRRGEVRGSRVDIGDNVYKLEKYGRDGIVLTPIRSASGPLHFTRGR
jgi:hypothetical protein